MYNYDQPTYRIADIYQTVEQEAYNILGMKIVLVRFVFPPGLAGSHLLPEREVPAKDMTLTEVVSAIHEYGPEVPIHFIEDDPVLCGVEDLIEVLHKYGHTLYLNTCGFFHISRETVDLLESLYVQTKPGLYPQPYLLNQADEIRAYWHPTDKKYQEHVKTMQELRGDRDNFYLVPYNVDQNTVQETLKVAMDLGWNFGLRLSSIAPNTDQFLQHHPEAEEVYHKRYKEALGLNSKVPSLKERIRK